MAPRERVIDALTAYPARHDHTPHHPEIGHVCCIDGRVGGGRHFNEAFGDHAVRLTEIAAVIPPFDRAPINIRAKLSFQKVKGIQVITVEGHSSCGGAETAFAYPDPAMAPSEDVGIIVQSIIESGVDLPRLCDAFNRASGNNQKHGVNFLARHLVLQSLANICTFPGINQLIVNHGLDLLPLFHILKQDDPRHASYIERFDVARGAWIRATRLPQLDGHGHHATPDLLTNMCARPNGCQSCHSCHQTIADSLEWVELRMPDGSMGELPRHISTLLVQNQIFFQHIPA